ncbi:hypothetical protein ES708_16257 [subsurface metagenome]
MNRIKIYILLLFFMQGCTHNRYTNHFQSIDSGELKFHPETYFEKPDLPSPALNASGREVVLVRLQDSLYTWFDATVENGDTFDYKTNKQGKGNQLLADEEDFTAFALRGIHSDKELANTKIITGRSVSQITVDGRPGRSSGAGFMTADETILSVLRNDNKTVQKLGLTHPDLARPMFHLWNVSRTTELFNKNIPAEERTELKALVYNEHEIKVQVSGSRGWQESIFNDEILGIGHLEVWRELNKQEMDFLKEQYQHLTPEQFQAMREGITHLLTGEMVLFYINQYGFYEGHSDFRADPVTIAYVFGIRSLEELHKATGGDLFRYFTTPFTNNAE